MGRIETDICVIGAGAGGLTVAAGASQMGAATVLVEKGLMGGDCLNYGCVPSKALIAAARAADAVRGAARFGVDAGHPAIDFGRVNDHVRSVIAAIAPQDSEERFRSLGVNVIRAAARFTGPSEIEAGGQRIAARRFVVATGSQPSVPPIPGLDGVAYLTNENIFELRQAPEHLIVIGGGPIGIELAQAYRSLGSRVTIVEMFGILGRDDPELAAVVAGRLRRDGRCSGGRRGRPAQDAAGAAVPVASRPLPRPSAGSDIGNRGGCRGGHGCRGVERGGGLRVVTDAQFMVRGEHPPPGCMGGEVSPQQGR